MLVLDEPTAVLPHDEVERLLAMVREVQRSGTSVLYVSHRLDEIFEIADRVTVLRAGRVVKTLPVAEVDHRGLAQLMVGADVDPDYRAPVAARPDSPVVLELRDVHGRRLHGVDLDVHRGEILGVAGLAGDGVQRAALRDRGPSTSSGHRDDPAAAALERMRPTSPMLARLGIPLVPADRAHEAIIPDFAVSENLTLSVLDRLGSRGKLSKAAEQKLVERWTRAARGRDGELRRADLDAQRRQPAEGRRGSLPGSRPGAARPVRADRRRRHRHARRDLRADRRAGPRRPDGDRVVVGPGRPAGDVHARSSC